MFIYFGEQCDPIKYYITIRIYNIPLEMVRKPRGGIAHEDLRVQAQLGLQR